MVVGEEGVEGSLGPFQEGGEEEERVGAGGAGGGRGELVEEGRAPALEAAVVGLNFVLYGVQMIKSNRRLDHVYVRIHTDLPFTHLQQRRRRRPLLRSLLGRDRATQRAEQRGGEGGGAQGPPLVPVRVVGEQAADSFAPVIVLFMLYVPSRDAEYEGPSKNHNSHAPREEACHQRLDPPTARPIRRLHHRRQRAQLLLHYITLLAPLRGSGQRPRHARPHGATQRLQLRGRRRLRREVHGDAHGRVEEEELAAGLEGR